MCVFTVVQTMVPAQVPKCDISFKSRSISQTLKCVVLRSAESDPIVSNTGREWGCGQSPES